MARPIGWVRSPASFWRGGSTSRLSCGQTMCDTIALGGEVRAVSQAELRIREAAKMGFKRCLLPERNLAKLDPIDGMELVGIQDVREALDVVLA